MAAFEVVRVQRGRRGVVLPEPEVVSTLVASTVADATGHYALDVPPGRYTVLVEHEDEWFPRIYSGADDTWHAQEATAGATVTLDMRVDRATH